MALTAPFLQNRRFTLRQALLELKTTTPPSGHYKILSLFHQAGMYISPCLYACFVAWSDGLFSPECMCACAHKELDRCLDILLLFLSFSQVFTSSVRLCTCACYCAARLDESAASSALRFLTNYTFFFCAGRNWKSGPI